MVDDIEEDVDDADDDDKDVGVDDSWGQAGEASRLEDDLSEALLLSLLLRM